MINAASSASSERAFQPSLRFLNEGDFSFGLSDDFTEHGEQLQNSYWSRISSDDPAIRDSVRRELIEKIYPVKTLGQLLDVLPEQYGDRPALCDVRQAGISQLSRLSHRQLHAAVQNEVEEMQISGVRKGTKIGFLGENSEGVYISMLAAFKIGAVVIPFASKKESGLAPNEAMEKGNAQIVYVTSATLEELQSALPSSYLGTLRDRGLLRGCDLASKTWLHDFDFATLQSDGTKDELVDPDDTAVEIFTSGTTGQPTLESIRHSDILHPVLTIPYEHDRSPGKRTLQMMPFYHIYGLTTTLTSLAAGSEVHLTDAVSMRTNGEAILQTARPHFMPSVPYGWTQIERKIRIGLQQEIAAGGVRGRIVSWARNSIESRMRDVAKSDIEFSKRMGISDDQQDVAKKYWAPVLETRENLSGVVLAKIQSLLGSLAIPKILRNAGLDQLTHKQGIATTGGAQLPSETLAFFRSIGVDLRPGYGATQASIVSAPNPNRREPLTFAGEVLPGVLVEAERGDEASLPELIVRSPNVAQGNGQSLSEKRHGKLSTHDSGSVFTRTGEHLPTVSDLLHIGPRQNSVVKLGNGLFANLDDFEQAVLSIPGISRVLVFPPPLGHQKPCNLGAFVVLDPDNKDARQRFMQDGDMETEELLNAIRTATAVLSERNRASISSVQILQAPIGRDDSDEAAGDLYTLKNQPKKPEFAKRFSQELELLFA